MLSEQAQQWPQHPEAVSIALRELPAYCSRQRWYPAKDAGPPALSLDCITPLEGEDAALAVWNVTLEGRETFAVFIPLAVITQEKHTDAHIKSIGQLADGRLLIDATESDAFIHAIVQIMLLRSPAPSAALQTGHTDQISGLGETPIAQWRIKRSAGEQSNTSIRIADKGILKILRKIAPGIHPELEMSRFLTEVAHFPATPALMGWITLSERTIAILQEYIPNEGDGWTWTRGQLRSGTVGGEAARKWLATLGRRTAEMHLALQAPSEDAAFKAQSADGEDWQRWARDLSAMAERVRVALVTGRSQLDPETERLADEFCQSVPVLDDWLRSLRAASPAWQKTRHHGDYHLGQVLVRGEDAVMVDFEGEPLRTLEERRAKHVPLRDVAGVLRSIQYVRATLERDLPSTQAARERSSEIGRLNEWSTAASEAFVHGYLTRLQDTCSQRLDDDTAQRIIQFFLIEKALYEVLYELSNRPAWTSVPLKDVVLQLARIKTPDIQSDRSTRRHRMPFGAEVQANGGVRFRLWAPQWSDVSLSIRAADGTVERTMTMISSEDGWYELLDADARAGTLYDYRLPDGTHVPDPASRFQPGDVHGPSEVIDPTEFAWSEAWKGRAWTEAVIYELHVGAFTAEGTFRAAIERLDHLVALGVSAIELMPIADYPGKRNWGYDGVLWYAPDSSYGRPEDLKSLVSAAHSRGIMVILDVVYNHFGPDGNFLPSYAAQFFTDRHKTPWGAAVNFDGADAHIVREFVIQNALYWLEEFSLDGLRFDAVHAIIDDSPRHLLDELAQRLRAGRSRPIHLLLENEDNSARQLARDSKGKALVFSAQWNDDAHHVLHVAATGESQGYYADYRHQTQLLGRALAEGFAFQGETMPYSGKQRGEPSAALPPTAFVAFIQNHDQIGNRAFGDRIVRIATGDALRAIAAVYLLLPQIPMLFMGEEWGCEQPFPFFCDFHGALGEAVRKGRREEFAKFPEFQDEANRERIPDPQAESTFLSAKLQWEEIHTPPHAAWLDFYRRILATRREMVVPILCKIRHGGSFQVRGVGAVSVSWMSTSGSRLLLEANLSSASVRGFEHHPKGLFWAQGSAAKGELSPWSLRWSLAPETLS